MISQKDIKNLNLSRDDVIKTIMTATGSTRSQAEFIYAIETGEIDGDVIAVNSEGKPLKDTSNQRQTL